MPELFLQLFKTGRFEKIRHVCDFYLEKISYENFNMYIEQNVSSESENFEKIC